MGITPIAVTDNCIEEKLGRTYPKIQVGDIGVNCLHYQTCKDAIDAWERREQRIKYENIYVIANSWDLNEDERLIEKMLTTGYRTAILTTNENYKSKKRIILYRRQFCT